MRAAGFGLAGFLFKKLDCDPAPMILGFVLGPMLEENFRRALVLSEGDFSVFVREPISETFLALAVLILVLSALPRGRQRRSLIAGRSEEHTSEHPSLMRISTAVFSL